MAKRVPSKLDPHTEWLQDHFLAGGSLREAQDYLHGKGLHASLGRLSEWWGRQSGQIAEERLIQQIATGAAHCRAVESAMGENPAPELRTLVALHRVLILKLSTEGTLDVEKLELVNRMMREVQNFARLEVTQGQMALERRKVELLERKAALLDKAKEVAEGPQSAEEKMDAMRAIFGMGQKGEIEQKETKETEISTAGNADGFISKNERSRPREAATPAGQAGGDLEERSAHSPDASAGAQPADI